MIIPNGIEVRTFYVQNVKTFENEGVMKNVCLFSFAFFCRGV